MIYVMSGGAKAFAVIGVTYPAGSVCTCTDGTKTLTLKDTGGQGFFMVPYAAVWTVTATDGEREKSESVEITTEGQSVNVELRFALELLKDGILLAGYEFGFSNGNYTAGNGLYSSASEGHGWCLKDSCKVDVTEYNSMTIKIGTCKHGSYTSFGLADSYNTGYIGYGSGHAAWKSINYGVCLTALSSSDTKGIAYQTMAANTAYVFDISGLTGEWMPKLSGYNSWYYITDIIFE